MTTRTGEIKLHQNKLHIPKPFVINFDTEADLYSFQAKKDKANRFKSKSATTGKGTKTFLDQDGLLPLPHPIVKKATAKAVMSDRSKRQELIKSLLNEKPVSGMTACLNLGHEAKIKIKQVRIDTKDTSQERELIEYTTVDIQFRADQFIEDDLPLNGVKIFDIQQDSVQRKSSEPAFDSKSSKNVTSNNALDLSLIHI